MIGPRHDGLVARGGGVTGVKGGGLVGARFIGLVGWLWPRGGELVGAHRWWVVGARCGGQWGGWG